MPNPFARPYETKLVLDLLAQSRGPADIVERMPAVVAEAQARKRLVEDELTELARLSHAVDRELRRDLKEPDTSNATILQHLRAQRDRRQQQAK
jgi:hypothetical protein